MKTISFLTILSAASFALAATTSSAPGSTKVDPAKTSSKAPPTSSAPFSLDPFLASAWADHKVTLQQKNVADFGQSSGFKPIEGMQIRLSQNEVIEDRKISLRVMPRGPHQLKLLSSLSDGQNRIEALNAQKAVTQALLERYLAAVDYVTAAQSNQLLGGIAKLRARRLSMLQAAARSSQARAVDLIKQREETEQADVKAGLSLSELRTAAVKMKALDPSFKEGESPTDLPTPREMLKVVSDSADVQGALTSRLARENADRQRDALNYEVAKDDRILEFVEVSYAEDKVVNDKALGVRLAFNIPGFASSELNRSEKARELVKYEVDAREAARKESTLQAEAREALAADAELYDSLQSVDERPSEKRMRRLVGQQDPLLAMTLDEESLQRQLHKIEVSAKAFKQYIAFLAESGRLAEKSHTNFLSRDFREIRE